jgi:hypothetical protein
LPLPPNWSCLINLSSKPDCSINVGDANRPCLRLSLTCRILPSLPPSDCFFAVSFLARFSCSRGMLATVCSSASPALKFLSRTPMRAAFPCCHASLAARLLPVFFYRRVAGPALPCYAVRSACLHPQAAMLPHSSPMRRSPSSILNACAR